MPKDVTKTTVMGAINKTASVEFMAANVIIIRVITEASEVIYGITAETNDMIEIREILVSTEMAETKVMVEVRTIPVSTEMTEVRVMAVDRTIPVSTEVMPGMEEVKAVNEMVVVRVTAAVGARSIILAGEERVIFDLHPSCLIFLFRYNFQIVIINNL